MKATVEEISRDPLRDGILLTLRICAPAAERVQVYRVRREDYESFFALSVGDALEMEELMPLIAEEEESRAYTRALKILGSADNTKRALERKLTERGFAPSAACAAVLRMEKEGYLREEEMLLRQLAVFKKRLWGPGKFLPPLLSKGFSRELIERARDRARDEGIYDEDVVKAELIDRFSPSSDAERRALLYKYGFRP